MIKPNYPDVDPKLPITAVLKDGVQQFYQGGIVIAKWKFKETECVEKYGNTINGKVKVFWSKKNENNNVMKTLRHEVSHSCYNHYSNEFYNKYYATITIKDNIIKNTSIRWFKEDTYNQGLYKDFPLIVAHYKNGKLSGKYTEYFEEYYNKPVITTDVGGLPEVVEDGKTGYIVPAENPPALAEAIIKYFKNNNEQEFSENIQQKKGIYSWEKLAETIEEFMI